MNDLILKTYRLEDLIDQVNNRYFIPPEFAHMNVIGKKDQVLKHFGGWVSARKIGWYLNKLGYSVQDWYDRWILNITVPSERPACKECGKPIPFSGKISWGYSQDYDGGQSFCSYDHYIKYWNSHRIEYFNRTAYKDRGRALYNCQGYEYIYLYLQVYSDKIKIGVTTEYSSTYGRFDYNTPLEYNDLQYVNIFKGYRRSVIKCEYKAKIKSINYIFEDMVNNGIRGCTETFKLEALNEIYKYIKTYRFYQIQ